MHPSLFHGFVTSLSLIVAIGSQNAFVLRQGIVGRHVFWVCSICALCDLALMSLGTFGLAAGLESLPWLTWLLGVLGSIFLLIYGARAMHSALCGADALLVHGETEDAGARALIPTLITTLAVTLLNPHVYLDTVVIVGGISTSLAPEHRRIFLGGSVLASALWFFGLGYGSRFLRPIFRKPAAWRILDTAIALVMWSIAYALINYALENVPAPVVTTDPQHCAYSDPTSIDREKSGVLPRFDAQLRH